MTALYLWINAILYAALAAWCTLMPKQTSQAIGFIELSASGRSEYAVIYGGLQLGMAFLFGVILGTGLPPAPVYILVAIVIGPPFIQVGVNPWVVHFFAFFVAVFGELTPPTSITAAITSKIANASFYVTVWRSVQICVSLFTLMAGVFVHPELVIAPGLDQMRGAVLILIATIGITFSIQACFSARRIFRRAQRRGTAISARAS
jgi:TRAP-type uncharacterized transport system fused permease subunit